MKAPAIGVDIWVQLVQSFVIASKDAITHLFQAASLLVSNAIKDLLNTFPIMLSEVDVCRLGVSDVLMLHDAAGDVGGRDVEGGFAAKEESPNRNLVFPFLGAS